MSVAGDESSSRDQRELADLITLIDRLVKDLEGSERTYENDYIEGGTRIYLTVTILPEVLRVLEGFPESLPVRVARNYVHARRAAEDLARLHPEDIGELGTEDLGKQTTKLRTKDELIPLRGILTALRIEYSRRGGSSAHPQDQSSGGMPHRWSGPPTEPGQLRHHSMLQEDKIFMASRHT